MLDGYRNSPANPVKVNGKWFNSIMIARSSAKMGQADMLDKLRDFLYSIYGIQCSGSIYHIPIRNTSIDLLDGEHKYISRFFGDLYLVYNPCVLVVTELSDLHDEDYWPRCCRLFMLVPLTLSQEDFIKWTKVPFNMHKYLDLGLYYPASR